MSVKLAQKVAFRTLYARLIQAMSLQEAKAVLGFPPTSAPSPEEIQKAYKRKVIENHPDRGGDHAKMVEVNVAKDLLDGKGRATWRPEPAPPRPKREEPKVVETIPGVDFRSAIAKSGVPMNVEWKCISKPQYAPFPEHRTSVGSMVWTLIGKTDQKIWVLSVKSRHEAKFLDGSKGGMIEMAEDWQANVVSMPANKNPLVMLPKLVRSPSVMFEDGSKCDPPKKWVVWDGGNLNELGVKKIKYGSGGAGLKDILLQTGFVSSDAKGVADRKSVVEIIPHYSKERREQLRAQGVTQYYGWELFDYEVRVNGQSETLDGNTVTNLKKNHFIMAVFSYDPKDNVPKQLQRLNGRGRLSIKPGEAIRLLADSLTSEPSWLHIALEKAAEEWEAAPADKLSYFRPIA